MRSINTKLWLAHGSSFQISEDMTERGVVSLELEGQKNVKVSKQTMEEICRKYLKHLVEQSWEDAEMYCINS